MSPTLQVYKVAMVPFMYSTDFRFQVLAPSTLYCTYCTHTVLHFLTIYVCVSQYCVYFTLLYFNFLTYFPAVYFHTTLSVIIPYPAKANLALIHAENLRLIRDRYLELCQKPTPFLFDYHSGWFTRSGPSTFG